MRIGYPQVRVGPRGHRSVKLDSASRNCVNSAVQNDFPRYKTTFANSLTAGALGQVDGKQFHSRIPPDAAANTTQFFGPCSTPWARTVELLRKANELGLAS
jgi:hypothetical protein